MSAAPLREPDPGNLLEALLADQQSLSAVERFARHHLEGEEGDLPADARSYEELIPVGRLPGPGQQLAFRVDLDSCTGCKACVTACHSLNGLAPDETWRDVGLLVGEGDGGGFQQTVTTTCHHCEDPACLSGCPVRAYEKDPITGIVRHLDDQCIGCQYCVLTCLYDVPKYHDELGIVRKCDMCAGRLAEGEAPACVQGCPNEAISIEIVDRVGEEGATRELLPGVGTMIPDSAVTRPTTRYVSDRSGATLRPADLDRLEPAPAHDPLAVMLVLMQLSVGTLLVDAVSLALGITSELAQPFRLALAAGTAALGLGAAALHLGRPQFAFRAFLGWRTSWMSREILVFGVYLPAVALAAISPTPASVLFAIALGLAGTVCSMMIYVATKRPLWSWSRTGPAFGATLVGLGALGAAAATACAGGIGSARVVTPLLLTGLVVLAGKSALETWGVARARRDPGSALGRTARLLRGPLRSRARVRLGLAAAGVAMGLTALALPSSDFAAAAGVAALPLFALGELVERHLYFTAEASPGMPGH